MPYPFLNTYEELSAELDKLGLTLPMENNTSVLAHPFAADNLSLPNRFVVQPMEGFDSGENGEPAELGFRRYERFAAGGAGLIWFEATAVRWEARSNNRQFWINEKNVGTFAKLVEHTRTVAGREHSHEIVAVLQLTHSGRYSKPVRHQPRPVMTQNSGVVPLPVGTAGTMITDDELDRLQDDYLAAAKLAAKAGFDGVDIKSCHGYLLNELLGSFTREGKYGGSLDNRTRFLRETMRQIADGVPNVFVTSRLSVFDAVKYPWGFGVSQDDYRQPDLTEPKQLVKMLKDDLGSRFPLVNITIGNPYFNPHFNRPYAKPAKGTAAYDEHPLIGVVRFVNIVKELQQHFTNIPLIGSGTAWLRHLVPKVAAGIIKNGYATLFGQGRCSFAYPNAVRDILTTGIMNPKKVCVACSGCTNFMRAEAPTGCSIRDTEVYKIP